MNDPPGALSVTFYLSTHARHGTVPKSSFTCCLLSIYFPVSVQDVNSFSFILHHFCQKNYSIILVDF